MAEEITRDEQIAAVTAVLADDRWGLGHEDPASYEGVAGAVLDALDAIGIDDIVSSGEIDDAAGAPADDSESDDHANGAVPAD